jgi:hypothetical protein
MALQALKKCLTKSNENSQVLTRAGDDFFARRGACPIGINTGSAGQNKRPEFVRVGLWLRRGLDWISLAWHYSK